MTSSESSERTWVAGNEPITGYPLVDLIGRELGGETWRCAGPFGVSKAIRISRLNGEEAAQIGRSLKNLAILRSIRHDSLLTIEHLELAEDFLAIIHELPELNLQARFSECRKEGMAGIPRGELLEYARQAAEILDVVRDKHGVACLDVRPVCLCLVNGKVKLRHLGLTVPGVGMGQVFSFDLAHAPSELISGLVESSSDQFALAVTYQELLTGSVPYRAWDPNELLNQHTNSEPNLATVPPCDRPALKRAFMRDPKARWPDCKSFVEAMFQAASPETRINIPGATRTPPPMPIRPKSSEPPRVEAKKGSRLFSQQRDKVKFEKRVDAPEAIIDVPIEGSRLHDSFVAFLPTELFAHKLRAFLDDQKPKVIQLHEKLTVLQFPIGGSMLQRKGWFLKIETRPAKVADYRMVDVTIWCSDETVGGESFENTSKRLVRYLQGFLMGDDKSATWNG